MRAAAEAVASQEALAWGLHLAQEARVVVVVVLLALLARLILVVAVSEERVVTLATRQRVWAAQE